MINIEEVRAALAAATPYASDPDFGAWCDSHPARMALWESAPTWLVALCDENERLRVEVAAIERVYRGARHGVVPMSDNDVVRVLEERDKALAQSARLRDGLEESRIAWTTAIAERDAALELCHAALTECVQDDAVKYLAVVAERDAALAEVERLRNPVIDWMQVAINREAERDAWRACAEILYQRWGDRPMPAEALAVYERLQKEVAE